MSKIKITNCTFECEVMQLPIQDVILLVVVSKGLNIL